jgi:hypothetical protein
MKRYFILMVVLLSVCKVGFAGIPQTLEQQLVDHAHPFGAHVFSTAPIDPQRFAEQHSLKNAPQYVHQLCHLSGLHCVPIDAHEVWSHIFPRPRVQRMMMRLNRMNAALFYRRWLVVPTQWKNLHDLDFSPMPLTFNTHGQPEVVVSLKKFAFAAYDKSGHLIRWGPATSGAAQCSYTDQSCLTPPGLFAVYKKEGAHYLSHTYPLSTHGGSPMPYAVFFHQGYSFHADLLNGFINHSHGCVYLFLNDIIWLNQHFSKIGTPVLIIG